MISSSPCIRKAAAKANSCAASKPSATSPSQAVEQQDPLPIALYPQGCLFRKWAIEALDTAGRPWRMAFVSHSLAAVEAVAAQGLAVTVVKTSTFPAKLRALSDHDGMPRLPAADICLHRAANLSPAGSLLADHLRSGISNRRDEVLSRRRPDSVVPAA
jgi:DNA-binding transcriptional LysR family regulator